MTLTEEEYATIESAWAADHGAMWKLRQGEVDVSQIESLLRVLDAIQVADDELLPRRFVSLVWYLPIFFEWQRERMAEHGGDMKAFQALANRVVAVVERVLGVP